MVEKETFTTQRFDQSDIDTKKILSTTEAFGLLRRELIDNLGVDRVKGFLLRYGWRLGTTDAEEAMKLDSSIDFLIKQASHLHLSTGQVGDIKSERFIEKGENENIEFIQGKGKWIDSFEAQEHIKHHGISAYPVCHTLTGYANGYMSAISSKKILVVETSCVGKGDKECIFETKLAEDWGGEIQEELRYYDERPIVEELENTYEQLLKERNYIDIIAKFHKQLTESVSNGSDLQNITDMVNRLLSIPVTIEDLSFQNIVHSGLDENKYSQLKKDIREELLEKQRKTNVLPSFTQTNRLEMSNHIRLVTPIFVQKKVIGYCSFIYFTDLSNKVDDDILFLERVANVTSLILLNEKTSFEALEKMKGNLLEQMLMGDYTSKEEIVSRGRYMNFDFNEPYYIAAIEFNEKMKIKSGELDYEKQFLETIAKYLDIQGCKALVGMYKDHIIMFIPTSSIVKEEISQIVGKLHKHMENTFSIYSFKIGLSNKSMEITWISDNVEKAIIALRMSNKNKITNFEDLGILGVLINSKNIEIIKEMANKQLGPLFKADQNKNNELIKTLYVFLTNGGNLHQTMDDLSLSMSGLTYRKNKIEKLIDKDLRNPSQSYQLLLILDSLIALQELEI